MQTGFVCETWLRGVVVVRSTQMLLSNLDCMRLIERLTRTFTHAVFARMHRRLLCITLVLLPESSLVTRSYVKRWSIGFHTHSHSLPEVWYIPSIHPSIHPSFLPFIVHLYQSTSRTRVVLLLLEPHLFYLACAVPVPMN